MLPANGSPGQNPRQDWLSRLNLRQCTAWEASGFLVGPTVFKTDEGDSVVLAGSIPVRLRS